MDIQQNNVAVLHFNLVNQDGSTIFIRKTKLATFNLINPSAVSVPITDIGFDATLNQCWVRIPKASNATTGQYYGVLNIVDDDWGTYTTSKIKVYSVVSDADDDTKSVVFTATCIATQITNPSGGNSPYYNATTGTWWQYSDTLKAFEDTGVGNLIQYSSTLNPYFSSKFIKRIEKSPADQSIATYINGIFDITLVNQYAGLNFWVDKDDLDVYYVINIKSAKYTTWDSSSANKITYGARKYNRDANTPSGLNVVNTITKVENDGSLTLGVRLQNPNSLEDAVYRIMFWGEADTVYISSLITYDEWEFEQCISGRFGITAQTAQTAQTAFNGTKYNEANVLGTRMNVSSISGLSISANGEYSGSVNVDSAGNYLILGGTMTSSTYYMSIAILNGTEVPENTYLRCAAEQNTNFSNILYSNSKVVGDKVVMLVGMTPREWEGRTPEPNSVYLRVNTAGVNIDCASIMGFSTPDNNFEEIFDFICNNVNLVLLNINELKDFGILTADKVKSTDSIINDIINKSNISPVPGIVCWGSSSTAGGGWVDNLATLTGMNTYNGGVGGESLWTILGRIGSEPIRLNQSITIPADTTPIQLGTAAAGGAGSIFDVRGHKVTPLLQGDGLFNPVIIDGIEGTIKWNGRGYDDPDGYYTFTRSEAGEERTTLPDEIVFSHGSRTTRNCIQILLLGYNQGYSSTEEYVEMVKRAKEFAYNGMCLIVGRHAAADKIAADKIAAEEVEFKKEFGMMFVSSREYMIAHGLEEAGIAPTVQDEQDIANGIIPSSLRADEAHFNSSGYQIYLNLIHRRLKELGYVKMKN